MKKNYQLELDNTIKNIIDNSLTPKLLLHSCCAPCSSYVLEYLSTYFEITIYFYNPNIDLKEEFERRSREQIRLIDEMNLKNKVSYVIEDYCSDPFSKIAVGHEEDVEGGERCTSCYQLRLRKTALYAKEHNFDYFTTTLSISPYKNSFKLNDIGMKLEEELNVKYLQADFKKKNGYKRSIELSKEYNLYRQDYCGCIYSKLEHEKRLEKKKQEQVIIPKEEIKEELVELDHTLYRDLKKTDIVVNKKENKEYKPKKSRKKVSSFLLILFLISVLSLPLFMLKDKIVYAISNKKHVKTEEIKANIKELYIYGNHLNIKGTLKLNNKNVKTASLYFYSKEKQFNYPINFSYDNGLLNFNIADKINEGLNPDELEINDYNIFLEVDTENSNEYYVLSNQTKYKTTNYYGISNKDKTNKYTFKTDELYETLSLNIKEERKKVYDVVIDPGHGGKDSGACFKGVCETNYTLDLAKRLKIYLEKNGLNVYLTRDTEKTLPTYGKNSRTGISYEKNAKLLVSIHLNAGPDLNGFEIYTPYNVNYEFANNLSNNLKSLNTIDYSKNAFNYVKNGVYTRTMAQKDLDNFVTDAIDNNYEKYEATLETNYYYMIRETGGYMTGAYVDGREGNRSNPYVDSNVGAESYILELGYITNDKDRQSIEANKKEYMKTLAKTIVEYLK